MATQLPSAQSQGRAVAPITTSKGGSVVGDLLSVAGALAPAINRSRAQSAAAAEQAKADQEDVIIGQVVAEQNQIDLDRQQADILTSDLQTSSLEVARAREDNEITEAEQVVIDNFIRQQKQLEKLKEQNPVAFSADKSFIQKSLKFQAALRQNPRLATKLVSARNALAAGPSKVSGSQVQKSVELEQEMSNIYGGNPTPAQRVEFSEFKLMERNNIEMMARNKIKADSGQLTADAIFTAATSNLDLAITKIDTAFINDQNAGGGFAKSERVEQYVSQLRVLQKNLENQVFQEVASQNKNGRGLIQRDVVAARLKPIQDEVQARIEMYQQNDSGALITKISDYQKKMIEVNGGNAVSVARQISGVRGDNIGSLSATINLMNNNDPVVKDNFSKLINQSGMESLTQSVDVVAGRLAGMMNSGIPLPKNLQAAGVYHGVLSMREGPVSESVKGQVLEGVSTIGLEDDIPSAVKILSDDSAARQLSGPQLKQTVNSLDGQVSTDIRTSNRNVSYDAETDRLVVFGLRGQEKVEGNTLIPTTTTRTFDERVFTDGDLTKSLNSLYDLRKSGKYASDLESSQEFLKFWLDTYGLEDTTSTEVTE